MSDRITTIVIAEVESEKFRVTGVSQSSSLSLILYLFYTAELLKANNNLNDRLSISVFVNDTTLLIYKHMTERNCRTLRVCSDYIILFFTYSRLFPAYLKIIRATHSPLIIVTWMLKMPDCSFSLFLCSVF